MDGGQGQYGGGLTKSWPTEKDWVSQVDASLEPFTTTHGFPAKTVVRRRPNILHTRGGGDQILPVRKDPDIWRPFR